jgi:hypothetical protein
MVPSRGGDLDGVAGRSAFEVRVRDWFAGGYGEATARAGALEITSGVRVDRFGLAQATTLDPRVNVRAGLGRAGALRFATGVYHQAPAPSYFDQERGASLLPAMKAVHYVAGYERGREAEGLYLRAESYVKRYTRLPVEDEQRGYVSDGHGTARGADVFAQWLSRGLELRGSVTWLHARRRWTPADQRERYALPAGTWAPDFEIPWSVHLIANVPLPHALNAGASWRSAAGRPHTPILGGVALESGIAPVFAALNSARFPRYARLDLSVSRLVPAGAGVAILFASLDNALGRRNVLNYVYAPDYSSKLPVVSASPRSVYVGVSFRRS